MTNFPHQHTAHCESGVMSTLLKYHGIDANEALVFGLASALTYVYLPLVKLAGMPLVSYRIAPRAILRRTSRALKIPLHSQTFRDARAGQAALDQALARGELVGLQTSVYWLPYFPPEMRFHFNAHNLLVYGKDGDDYLVSDPVFETVQRCPAADLQRARFAKGALAAKGLMYTISRPAHTPDWATLLPNAIAQNARHMLAPVFFVGVRGMKTVAKKIAQLPDKPEKYQKLFLGHLVRMQEEIGTGGAGFRYLYAYFLEQAADLCDQPAYLTASQTLTAIGDDWRQFASHCVRQCKTPQSDGCAHIADALRDLAAREETLWREWQRL
ncbi:MAG: BtrH N-terminal domain-containing protein [Cardiobacteriaceae bacterium]|nr:BtrH N-terminal domain-containing protein [Cardiobacteriaceae bacterium]